MAKLNKAISQIRVELQQAKINKSGKNNHAGFTYFELADFLPNLNILMLKHGVNDVVSFENETAKLTLVCEDEKQDYSIPFVIFDTPVTRSGSKSMQDIQYLGALITYYKRYLYMNAFGITDGEVVDSLDNDKLELKSLNESKKKLASELQKEGLDANQIKAFAKFFDCGTDTNTINNILKDVKASIDIWKKNI